jgi:hypothetical protein
MGFWKWIFGGSEQIGAPPLPLAVELVPPRLPAAPPLQPVMEQPVIAPKPAPPHFGIDAAIALMRALPMDEDPELVLRVVRKTLRSTGISVEELIDTAEKREGDLLGSIAEDRRTIEQLERDIADRRTHIETLAKQLAETTSVRERLQEAVQTESKVGMLLPPDEMARLQAERVANEAAARPDAPIPPPPGAAPSGVFPPSVAPRPLKTSAPPTPKSSAAPPRVKSMTPQPPRVAATHPPKVATSRPAPAPNGEEAAVATPVTPNVDALLVADDPQPSEPTIRKAIDVSSADESEKST